MTGSFPIVETDALKLEQIFGKPHKYATIRTLIDLGILSYTNIIVLFLNHRRESGTRSTFTYHQEMKFIRESRNRKDYIVKLFNKISDKGITVGLFNTTKYGVSIYESLTNEKLTPKKRNSFEYQKSKNIFFIDGKTKSTVREKIRLYLNSDEAKNCILIGQTSVIDTGVNLPKLKSLVFIEPPGKSFTKIIQSIGRVMRKHKDKNGVYVFDLVDVFDYAKENYSLKHF